MILRLVTPSRLCVVIALIAIALYASAIAGRVSLPDVPHMLMQPDPASFDQIYVRFSLLPRILVAILAGGALAFAGTIFQQILRNPLAEPSTLGVLSGAQLAITLLSLSVATVSAHDREIAGLAGGIAAVFIVAGLARRSDFSPMTLLLCGMVISFSAGSASVILALFHHEYLRGVFIWGSGSLIQNDYTNAQALASRLVILIPALLLFSRPLAIIGLDETQARGLGLSPSSLRIAVLFLATVLSACVVARVGVIAFIGLAATNIVRLSGARTLRQRLVWGTLLGAALLMLADSLVLVAAPVIGEVPTGTITAITGAVLMLLLVKYVPHTIDQSYHNDFAPALRGKSALLVVFVSVAILALLTAFSLTERFFTGNVEPSVLFAGRWPRVLTSASAGAMLGIAGAVTQAMTRNPIASPEGLGVSGGAGLGIILAFFAGGMASPLLPLAGGVAGAMVAFTIVLIVARGKSYAPGPVLLSGIAISALATALISLIVASGDPRASYILAWTMGPTFRATSIVAIIATALVLIGLSLSPLFRRALEILPLGDSTARSLGVNPSRSRLLLLVFAAFLTGIATMIVGPLSFVGMMAPHLARMTGARSQMRTLLTAGVTGAAIMICADWFGRAADFPYEIPAGVIAAFIGGPYFLFVISSRGKASSRA
ncbi:Fe(3+)-hydroxamate ABC transporter permease FhuB [Agrobacterium sp. NPDC090273]|uniref:Fe(3+)-hydroxamate ABC transporter permease FhuB n=1 Tax=Agrobacterium sp. NPDC090273 TaxID=3363919 RepID=UPI00383AA4D6